MSLWPAPPVRAASVGCARLDLGKEDTLPAAVRRACGVRILDALDAVFRATHRESRSAHAKVSSRKCRPPRRIPRGMRGRAESTVQPGAAQAPPATGTTRAPTRATTTPARRLTTREAEARTRSTSAPRRSRTAQWSKAFEAPILPPFRVGGIDLSAGGTFAPVTIEDVLHGTGGQAQLCQGSVGRRARTVRASPPTRGGPSQQLQACYDPATHNLTFFLMLPGLRREASPSRCRKLYNGAAGSAGGRSRRRAHPADLNFVWQMGAADHRQIGGRPHGAQGQGRRPALVLERHRRPGREPALPRADEHVPAHAHRGHEPDDDPAPQRDDRSDYDCLAVAKCRTSANARLVGRQLRRPRAVGIYFDAANSQSNDAATAAEPVGHLHVPGQVRAVLAGAVQRGARHLRVADRGPEPALQRRPDLRPVLARRRPLAARRRHADALLHALHGRAPGATSRRTASTSRGNRKIDQTSMAKLLGAQHHTAEWFQFSVVGINQNFSADKAELTDRTASRRSCRTPCRRRTTTTSRPTSTSTSVPAARS